MTSTFWELFVRRVSSPGHPQVSGDFGRLVEQAAGMLAEFDAPAAAEVLAAFSASVAERYDSRRANPSDAGAPAGAPKPVPVPAEVRAAAMGHIDEAQIAQDMAEIRAGGGRTLDEFLPDLQRAASAPDERRA